MNQRLRIGIAEMHCARAPGLLVTHGLGSCLGITLYDATAKIGAMAHTLLPEPRPGEEPTRPAKFVVTAVEQMLVELAGMGVVRERLVAKLVGGANMFVALQPPSRELIGERNARAARETLAALNIPLVGEDTGGEHGRSAEFDLSTGDVRIRTLRARDCRAVL
ncbi:chemotaxis protein CheD [Geoalkalibacter subterraneus]|jgi:chemotaxis protein CheD|uniref:Probable chemoreceptor glutamine deamidase CheD n=1 Tax=Geoalkalibacter subterraneus TaxID=483547 RepID=A0A0B5FHQ5_9BACT|nr:chemotaxis protein CheD [Geoalkalibacter subterraneus]AJF07722.1 hypothetical protein GSUB_15790 [Geoalkalibacter subterraneus]